MKYPALYFLIYLHTVHTFFTFTFSRHMLGLCAGHIPRFFGTKKLQKMWRRYLFRKLGQIFESRLSTMQWRSVYGKFDGEHQCIGLPLQKKRVLPRCSRWMFGMPHWCWLFNERWPSSCWNVRFARVLEVDCTEWNLFTLQQRSSCAQCWNDRTRKMLPNRSKNEHIHLFSIEFVEYHDGCTMFTWLFGFFVFGLCQRLCQFRRSMHILSWGVFHFHCHDTSRINVLLFFFLGLGLSFSQ